MSISTGREANSVNCSAVSTGNNTQVTELSNQDQVISALLHGLSVIGMQHVRGRGSCIPYTAMINEKMEPVFLPSFGSLEYQGAK